MSRSKRPLAPTLALVSLAIGGCVPHAELAPTPEIRAANWSSQPPAAPSAEAAPVSLGAMLGSSELDALIERGLSANADLGAAQARIRQARALLRSARGAMLPVVSASAGLSGTRTQRTSTDPFDFSDAFAGLDISFDIDLFGAGRAERRAAGHRLRAAEFDRDATGLAVRSDIARTYVQRAALGARIALIDQSIAQASELERIIRARLTAGDATRVDLGLQTIQVRELQVEKLRLEGALDNTRTALAVLVGEEAPLFRSAPARLDSLTVPALAPLQPGALLVHRPDIRAAEARIEAAGGDVAQARAAFFPRLRISASALGQAASLSGPLGSTISIGSGLLAPIFDRGRLRSNLELMAGRQVESVELYRQILLTSLADAENALAAVARGGAREALLGDIVEQARLTSRLARLQYLEGEADLQRVFDAEQRLSAAEDARAVALQERLEAAINLYQSMGGAVALGRS